MLVSEPGLGRDGPGGLSGEEGLHIRQLIWDAFRCIRVAVIR